MGLKEPPRGGKYGRWQRAGEMIAERMIDGQIERRFSRSAYGRRVIEVRMTPPSAETPVPKRATLTNGWLGYALEVETLSVQSL